MKELKFNAKGSDKLNWFSFSRLNQSSWTDMKTQPNNYFSIHGDPGNGRHFLINSNYGGCLKDAGWMVIIAKAPPSCDWEKRFQPRQNVILYSKGLFLPTGTNAVSKSLNNPGSWYPDNGHVYLARRPQYQASSLEIARVPWKGDNVSIMFDYRTQSKWIERVEFDWVR